MARQLAAIKLRSMWSDLRSQTYVLVLSILAYLYGLALVGTAAVSMVIVGASGQPIATTVLTAIPGIYTLGWIVIPLVFASQEQTLEPLRLTPYVSYSRKLAASLVAVGAVGAAGIYFLIIQLGALIGWALYAGWAGFLWSLLGSVVGTTLALVCAKALGTWFGRRKGSSSSRKEKTGMILGILFLLVLIPAMYLAPMILEGLNTNFLLVIVSYLQWTPFGAPWALPESATAGLWGAVAIQLAISVVTIAAGWWLMLKALKPAMFGSPSPISAEAEQAITEGRHLIDPEADTHAVDLLAAGSSPRYLPGVDTWQRLGLSGPSAAVAERTRIYWFRDSRLVFQLVTPIMMAIVAIVVTISDSAVFNNASWMLFIGSFALGAVAGTLLQYDSTAFWVHVSTGIRGFQDRLGRILPTAIISLAIILVATIIYGVGTRASVGTIAYLFCGGVLVFTACAAGATLIGSQWIYPVQPPGTSPMATKGTGQFGLTLLVGLAQSGAGILLAAIPGALMIWAAAGSTAWRIGAAVFALVWSVAVTILGVWLAGKIFDRSKVELLTKIRSWPGHGVRA